MQTTIKKLTNEHEAWKSEIAFYRDEIKFFQGKLQDVAKANNVHPVIEKIEHFQNMFNVHDSKLSDLNHSIDQYVHNIYNDSVAHANHVTPITAELFESLKERVAITTRLHTELKEEFKNFLQKVL